MQPDTLTLMQSNTDLLRALMTFVRTANKLELLRYGPHPTEQIHNLLTCYLVTISPCLFFTDAFTTIIIKWRGHNEYPSFDRTAISADTRLIITSIMHTAGIVALPDREFNVHLPASTPAEMDLLTKEIQHLTNQNIALLVPPPPEITL